MATCETTMKSGRIVFLRLARPVDSGFTLIELLAVIAIMGILLALLVPALAVAKGKVAAVVCTTNLRQFGLAFHLYSGDNQDAILPNKDGQNVRVPETWVEGWLGVPGPDCTNVLHLRRSLLARYVPEPRLWRCPASKDPTVGVRMPRVRTISLNGFMGGVGADEGGTFYRRLSDITRPSPSEALIFIEERIDTINDGTFALQARFDASRPNTWVLRDKPGIDHREGGNIAFADGRAEARHWRDRRTVLAPRDDAVSPGNADILWLEEHATWRPAQPRPE
ncbi:MAG: prepilin-type N-terminal cleavage/methylation domain-containing protein [Verrucomicrobiota bacterium]